MAHSTCKVVNRKVDGLFGSPEYAKEELIAELTSAIVGNTIGYDVIPREENTQYLRAWLNSLGQEPKFLKSVLAEVSKAATVIDKEIELTKEKLNELDHEREGYTGPEWSELTAHQNEMVEYICS